jgi:hypothetical protein
LETIVTACIVLFAAASFAQPHLPPVRFAAVDIMIDPHGKPLAAYQLDFRATHGNVLIVGIEGGEHPAFHKPPYYDPKAMQQERVIIAALSTAASLPTGKTRIATIHLQITGDTKPQYKTELTTAATTGGEAIHANIILEGGL